MHVHNKTLDQVTAEIASALRIDEIQPALLADKLTGRGRTCRIVVDALDEADNPDSIIDRLLVPLGNAREVQLLVATRIPYDSRLRNTLQQIVPIDLDKPPYFTASDVVSYVDRRLRIKGPYQDDIERRQEIANAVSRQAKKNFLIAHLVSRYLREQPDGVSWDHQFPDSVSGAMEMDLRRFDDDAQRTEVLDILSPLAYAEGSGIPREGGIWEAMASAVAGKPYNTSNVTALLDNDQAKPYIATDTEGEPDQYRLYHEELAAYLRQRLPGDAQSKITAALLDMVPDLGNEQGKDWTSHNYHPYIRDHLAAHAAKAGELDGLALDPGYLLAAEPAGLLRVLPRVESDEARQAAAVYQHVVHLLRDRAPAEAAAYLEFVARCDGAERLGEAVNKLPFKRQWRTTWTCWRTTSPNIVVGRHEGEFRGAEEVRGVAVGEVAGRPVVVSAGYDETVRRWDLETGAPAGEPLLGHEDWVGSVAVGEVVGRPVAVSTGRDGTVRRWDLETGAPIGEPLRGHGDEVRAVAVGEVAGRPVVVSAGEDGTVCWCDMTQHWSTVLVDVGTPVLALAMAGATLITGTDSGIAAVEFGLAERVH